jgi:hypothetical protein
MKTFPNRIAVDTIEPQPFKNLPAGGSLPPAPECADDAPC